MTIASTTNRISTVGNDVTTAYPVAFPFHAKADLIVVSTVIATGVQTTKTLTTHYTISGTPDALGHYSSGGSVDFVTAPASTERITIYRDPARTQGLDLVENDSLPAESVEAQFDYLTMLVQRVSDLIGRSLRQPDGDSANVATMPALVDRISSYAGYDASGDPVALSAPTSTSITSAFSLTLLDDTNAAAARTTLDVPSVAEAKQIAVSSHSAAYPIVLTDAGTALLHPTADNNPRTFTIPANGAIAFPVGTCLTFVNQINVLTIAITSDTMTLSGAGTTGSRTLAASGSATAFKVSTTEWIISGTGLS